MVESRAAHLASDSPDDLNAGLFSRMLDTLAFLFSEICWDTNDCLTGGPIVSEVRNGRFSKVFEYLRLAPVWRDGDAAFGEIDLVGADIPFELPDHPIWFDDRHVFGRSSNKDLFALRTNVDNRRRFIIAVAVWNDFWFACVVDMRQL